MICLVLTGTLGVWTLLALLALPRLWKVLKVLSTPAARAAPPELSALAALVRGLVLLVTRRAGALFVLGLLLDAIYPVHLPT